MQFILGEKNVHRAVYSWGDELKGSATIPGYTSDAAAGRVP